MSDVADPALLSGSGDVDVAEAAPRRHARDHHGGGRAVRGVPRGGARPQADRDGVPQRAEGVRGSRRQVERRGRGGAGRLIVSGKRREFLARRIKKPPSLTAHHFDEQREFYRPRKRSLRAALCSRRAGKTRGGYESDVSLASVTPNGRFLYITETRGEAKRLAWFGARGDGMASLVRSLGLVESGEAITNDTELSIHFPKINSWIFLIGVDDEHAITRALGMPWNRVRWDEAQRIPPKFTETIKETMLPTLLDYKGEFLMTGTAERKMSGMFYDITRPEIDKRSPGWDVHRWTLVQNPYWGRAKDNAVVWGPDDELVSGPHAPDEIEARSRDARTRTA